tara:strand:+ start:257 stop:382 length:126 start_codon:yes stop_codon:yes gene_type:complete
MNKNEINELVAGGEKVFFAACNVILSMTLAGSIALIAIFIK